MKLNDFIKNYKYNFDIYNKNLKGVFCFEDIQRFYEKGNQLEPADLFEEYDSSLDQEKIVDKLVEFLVNFFRRINEKQIALEEIVYITYYAMDSFFIQFKNNPKNFHFNTRANCVGMFIVE